MVGRYEEGWKVRVKARAERGRANDELVALVCTLVGVERGRVRLVAGTASRDKLVEIDGVTLDEVDGAFARAAGEGR